MSLIRNFVICLLCWVSLFAQAEDFVLGRVSSNVTKTVNSLKPIAEYVQTNLPESRFTGVSIKVAKDLEELIHWAKEGKVHWVTESAFAAARLSNETPMMPTLARYKKGQKSYGSVLVVHNHVHSLDGLLGQKIAAEDPGSFSGYFLIFQALRKQGYNVAHLLNVRSPALEEAVNIVFSDSEKNNQRWLQHGLVQGAIFSDHEYDAPVFLLPNQKNAYVDLIRTEQFPRAIELFSSTLTTTERSQISELLIALTIQHDALQSYDQSTGFHKLSETELGKLKEIYDFFAEKDCNRFQ